MFFNPEGFGNTLHICPYHLVTGVIKWKYGYNQDIVAVCHSRSVKKKEILEIFKIIQNINCDNDYHTIVNRSSTIVL